MILCIGNVLDEAGVTAVRSAVAAGTYVDGVSTAGWASRRVKKNEQLRPGPELQTAQRIISDALRGRPEEQAIPTSYLRRLQELYDAWFSRYDLSETVVIETDKLDYLHDLVDRIDLFDRIEKILKLRRDPGASLDE